ncbi:MAG: hypothetical protein FJ278_20570 [Planctomycetes bacterium]|nr:hypothetical protein [Planctomycetota bacterium]
MRFAILFLESSVAVLSFWVLDLSQPRLVVLTPLVAALVSLACFGLGRGLSRLHEHQPKSAGSYVACSMFSNVGLTLGGFLCFMLLGEQGLSVALLYSAYFIPFFFSVGFGVARSYNSAHKASLLDAVKDFCTNPLSLSPNLGLVAGIILDVAGVPRPQFLGTVNQILVYTAVGVYSAAIGLTMRFGRVRAFLPECLSMAALKFLATPLIGLLIGWLLGCGNILDGLLLKVVFVEACMPVAIFALVLTKLFDLDQDLANSCWLVTTFGVVLMLPGMAWVVRMM